MARLGIASTPQRPDLRRHVCVCTACNHWQIDVRAGAISDLGGWLPALEAMALEHSLHLNECVNAEGRINVMGKWVEPPLMSDGKPANGTLVFYPVPRWWVTQ